MDSTCRIARVVNFLVFFLVFCSFSNPSRASPGFQFVNNTYDLVAKQLGISKLPSFTTTSQCNDSLVSLSKDPESLLLYLDAWGKPPSGILAGNVLEWLGSYSECTKMIEGAHYCLVEIDIAVVSDLTRRLSVYGKALDKIKGYIPYFPYTSWGICAPQQCTEQDITEGLNDFFTVLNLTGTGQNSIKSVHCNKRAEYTTGVIMTIVLCGLILTLCLVATIIDIFRSFTTPPPVKKQEDCLPVRRVSVAIYCDDTFYVRNSVGDNNTGSTQETQHTADSISLISPPNHPIAHTQPEKASAVIRFFLCFSLIQNTNRILDTELSPGAIKSIHGMRVLSMWWVILGHTFYFMCFVSKNFMGNVLVTYAEVIRRSTFEVILNATLSVDSFFFLSGLLVGYVSLRQMEKRNGNLLLFQFYFHRFLRLTPTYMFVLLFNDKIFGFLGEGPFWFEFRSKVRDCSKYWWTNLLYINNFYPMRANDMCMPWAWYLAVDMQLHIFAPLVLFSAYRFRLRGLLTIVGLLMTASFVTTAAIVAHYDEQGTTAAAALAHISRNSARDEMSLIYVKPYCRIAPYLIGMTLGYLLLCKKDWKRSKVSTYFFNVAGWCVAITLALLTLYGPDKNDRIDDRKPFTRLENIMYATFARSAWSLAIAWVIFACQRGLGGLVDKLLSAGFWIPFSRLTYCAYLVHPIVLNTLRGTQETVNTYSDVHLVCLFAGVLTISYGVAFVVSVCVEFPMIQLETMLRDGKK